VPELYSSQQIVKALEREGFAFVSQRGSHVKYRKTGASIIFTVIVPAGREQIPRGTSRSILRQSGLDEGAFGRN
jgi:predicted RNA binding protein YcfA (HicA-like mRNA interferase family)